MCVYVQAVDEQNKNKSWETRLLECKEIKPSILKEVNTEYSLEGHVLKLKFQYFSHLMQRADSLEKKKPDAGKD